MDLFENAVFILSSGRVGTELFENADVTASIYNLSEQALGSLVDHTEAFCSSVFFYGSSISKFVIEHRISLLNGEFRMPQRFHVDGDIFKNGPRVDANLFYADKKGAFSKRSGYVWTGPQCEIRTSINNLGKMKWTILQTECEIGNY